MTIGGTGTSGRAGEVAAPTRGSATLIVVMLSLCGEVVSLQQMLVLPPLAELPRLLDTSASNASWT